MPPASPAFTDSARAALQAAHAAYPDAWRIAETLRETRARPGIPDWPAWCYLPMAGWYAAVARIRQGGQPLQDLAAIGDVSRLAALGTWRMSQGVFSLDAALHKALASTPVSPDTPCSALFALPQWCIYVQTPGALWQGKSVKGYWAHLEFDANGGGNELRLLLDGESSLQALAVPLSDAPLAQALQAARLQAAKPGRGATGGASDAATDADFTPWVMPLLHIASPQAVFTRQGVEQVPANPAPRKTKRGLQLFAAAAPVLWAVSSR